jgi:hypothetical protein
VHKLDDAFILIDFDGFGINKLKEFSINKPPNLKNSEFQRHPDNDNLIFVI